MMPEARFWAKFEEGPTPEARPDLGPCLLWTKALNPQTGYGQVWDWRAKKVTVAHRVAFELTNGPIPTGLQVDHLCRVRRCGRPTHLEAVTGAVNIQRGHQSRGTAAVHACACGATISTRNRQCRTCYLTSTRSTGGRPDQTSMKARRQARHGHPR